MGQQMTKYVLQRADGQFYYKRNTSSSWGFTDDFTKAHLFDTEKGARSRQSLPAAGEGAKVRPVIIALMSDETVYIPSVWTEDRKSTSPSSCAWCSMEGDKYESGIKYYDEDMNEITKEEYEKLVEKYGKKDI